MVIDLKEKSREISESLKALENDLKTQREITYQSIEETREDVKVASAMGDRSENVAFSDAVQKLQQLQTTMASIEQRLKLMKNIKDTDEEYVPIDMIVMYSTFKIRDSFGEVFIFKMYPEGVSDIDRNILDKNSPLGKLLWRRVIGDVITLNHKVTGEPIDYTILEIY